MSDLDSFLGLTNDGATESAAPDTDASDKDVDPPVEDEVPGPFTNKYLQLGKQMTPLEIVIFILLLCMFIYLAGASERGTIKIVERNALAKGHAPGSFTYFGWNLLNSFTFGIMGLLANMVLEDPFANIPVLKQDGKTHKVHFDTSVVRKE